MARFFHVDRDGNLSAGRVLQLVPWDAVAGDRIPDESLQQHVEALFPQGLSRHGQGYLFWQGNLAFPSGPGVYDADTLNGMRSRAIELVYEYVRQASFDAQPSRYESWFGWESLDAARRFMATMGVSKAPIWEIEGRSVFRADMNLLMLDTALRGSLSAHQYWRGEAGEGQVPQWEHFIATGAEVVARAA